MFRELEIDFSELVASFCFHTWQWNIEDGMFYVIRSYIFVYIFRVQKGLKQKKSQNFFLFLTTRFTGSATGDSNRGSPPRARYRPSTDEGGDRGQPKQNPGRGR